jgi:hypothetical protein
MGERPTALDCPAREREIGAEGVSCAPWVMGAPY